jgi:hypothetical protein
MNVEITFEGTPTEQDSYEMQKLVSNYRTADLPAEPIVQPSEIGTKDGGLAIGLTIVGLALAAVSTVAAVVATWGSKNNYSIEITSGDVTVTANNLSADELTAAIRRLETAAKTSREIKIRVSGK